MIRPFTLSIFSVMTSASPIAQKGAPQKAIVTMTHTTNYPQRVDFNPALVSKLKAPTGWSVKIAATGLGKTAHDGEIAGPNFL